jgi:hypothetical protein
MSRGKDLTTDGRGWTRMDADGVEQEDGKKGFNRKERRERKKGEFNHE